MSQWLARIQLPWPPSNNDMRIPIIGRSGKPQIVLSNEAARYKRIAQAECMVWREGRPTIDQHVTLLAWMRPPSNRRYDIDNFWKLAMDAMTDAGVWTDDSLCVTKVGIKRPVLKGGGIRLEVWPATPPTAHAITAADDGGWGCFVNGIPAEVLG